MGACVVITVTVVPSQGPPGQLPMVGPGSLQPPGYPRPMGMPPPPSFPPGVPPPPFIRPGFNRMQMPTGSGQHHQPAAFLFVFY